ncbi:hypothetical protein LINPERHAP1_LOCUS24902 [Linum perenne]
MKGHNRVSRANKLAPNENSWNRRVATELNKGPLHLLATWVLIQLVNGGAHTLLVEEPLDCMAHVARALAEDHHRLLRSQLRHLVHDTTSYVSCGFLFGDCVFVSVLEGEEREGG